MPAWISSKSSCFSPGRMRVRARRPWRRLFMEAVALPSGLFGPVHFCALRRFAATCFFVAMELPFLDTRNQWGELALANIGKKRRCYEGARGRRGDAATGDAVTRGRRDEAA